MEFVILAIPYMRRLGEQVGRAGSDPNRFQALMANLRTQMRFAESVGYTGFCMTEQHLQVEGIETTTNPLFWDYFVAQHTERMRVGQLGMNLTAVNPIQLAENLAMLESDVDRRNRRNDPHPPVYAPFSYSMGTAKFWAREGGKMMGMFNESKEDFIPLTLDVCLEEALQHGRIIGPNDMLALGGHLIMGRNPAETKKLYEGFEWLFNFAYNAPPYHVPMGRLWMGSRQQVLDHVGRLNETFGIEEFFLWHHVGWFEQDEEMAMLHEFAEGVIGPLSS